MDSALLLPRDFATEGLSVVGWVRRRRLERCRADLLDPALAAVPGGAIGARWGLPGPAGLSRAFRAAYGVPPGELRRAGLVDGKMSSY